MIEKTDFLFLKLNYLKNIAQKIGIKFYTKILKEEIIALTVAVLNGKAALSEWKTKYKEINAELQALLVHLLNTEEGINIFYTGFIEEIYLFIREKNKAAIKHFLHWGETLFEGGVPINAFHPIHHTLLSFAISQNALRIAKLLLKYGANPNLYFKSGLPPIITALQAKNTSALKLLISYGAQTDPKLIHHNLLPFALETKNLNLVKVLHKQGLTVSLEKQQSPFSSPAPFSSSITYALDIGAYDIAVFLLSTTLEHSELFRVHFTLFLLHAPLSAINLFIENKAFSLEEKFATLLISKFTQTLKSVSSAEFLFDKLLSQSNNESLRLSILKKCIALLLDMPFLSITIENEPCYPFFNQYLHFIQEETKNSPKGDLAAKMVSSIKKASLQGPVAAGFRLLSIIANKYASKNQSFDPGYQLIRRCLIFLRSFRVPEAEYFWPEKSVIDFWLEKESAIVLSELSILEKKPKYPPSSLEACRFRAMVGSSIFSLFNPNLKAGGQPKVAVAWYVEMFILIMNILAPLNMLRSTWNKKKVTELLKEMVSIPVETEATTKEKKAYGFDLNLPSHFVPGILYQEQGFWVYSVLCRSFLQPLDEPNKGIVQFIIPEKKWTEVYNCIKTKSLDRKNATNAEDSSVLCREIYHQLFSHFTEIEKITGSPCFYSEKMGHKTYKEPTCFASNMKLFFPIILNLIVKSDAPSESWEAFNQQMQKLIKHELEIHHYSIENIASDAFVTTEPKDLAYKYITLLLRWREMNRFLPQSPMEKEGKKATFKQLLELTSLRMDGRLHFFQNTRQETETSSSSLQRKENAL